MSKDAKTGQFKYDDHVLSTPNNTPHPDVHGILDVGTYEQIKDILDKTPNKSLSI